MRVPARPPNWRSILRERGAEELYRLFEAATKPMVREFIRAANDEYVHWDKLRYRPMPPGMDAQGMWAAIQLSRANQWIELPIAFTASKGLHYCLPPQQQEWLHQIDQKAGGYLGTSYARTFPDDDERYLFNSLMEEAIASSQLEGACTTHKVAKQMLRTNRRPRDKAEQMILNNYKAILEIRDLKTEKLTPKLLCHLQQVLTDKTLDNPGAAGRFRKPDEYVVVVVCSPKSGPGAMRVSDAP
jgi:hypothetical protein